MSARAVVVDDEIASATAIGGLLSRLGCAVTVCTNARAAVPLVMAGDVDLVSLDLCMPMLDGRQALALIRSHEYTARAPSVPVIAITGLVAPEDRVDALVDGFAAHLGKPIMVASLRGALERAVTLRGALRRMRYTDDRATIEQRMQHVGGRADAMHTVLGLALAVEQQGRSTLREALLSAFAGNAGAARARLIEFAGFVGSLGALGLSRKLHALTGQLDQLDPLADPLGGAAETAIVLVRAELDRVIFTLREQVHRD